MTVQVIKNKISLKKIIKKGCPGKIPKALMTFKQSDFFPGKKFQRNQKDSHFSWYR
jgi:hypothetical protein